MANHGFVKIKHKTFDYDTLTADLQEINQRRFNGVLKIEREEGWSEKGGWLLSFPLDIQHPSGIPLSCWIATSRTFEIRHSPGDLNWWVDAVVLNELALKYDGMISDEGTGDEKWAGEPNKYPTYRSWLDAMYSHGPKLVHRFFVSSAIKAIPKELRQRLADKLQ